MFPFSQDAAQPWQNTQWYAESSGSASGAAEAGVWATDQEEQGLVPEGAGEAVGQAEAEAQPSGFLLQPQQTVEEPLC